MNNILELNGLKAKIVFDPEIEMFRGEILGLSGTADFYAENVQSLKDEMKTSLEVYLEVCQEEGIEPYKHYSGKIAYRTASDIHQKLEALASAQNVSVNKLIDKFVVEGIASN